MSLSTPAAPSLPIAPKEYEARYHDQFNNVLRLYFNQLQTTLTTVTGGDFGQIVKTPNIGAYYYPDQYASGSNVPTIVNWGATSSLYGFTLNTDNTATATYAGVYKITYSIQLANSANSAHDAIFWLRVNGSTPTADVADSTTIFTVPARKSAGSPAYTCAYSEVVFQLNAGDSVALWWGTDAAAATGVDGVSLYARTAQTSPMPYPETPSAIGSITFVSALPTT